MEKSLPFRSSAWRGAGEGRAIHYIYRGAENRWDLWWRVNGIRGGEQMGFVAKSKWALWRRACGICDGEPVGFVEESKWSLWRRANGIRGKHQKSEGSTTGGGSLRCPVLGGADGGSTPVPECFILFHGVFHLVAPEHLILFQPSILSRCTRAFYLVSTKCFILLHPSVSSCCTRVFRLVSPERLISLHPSVSSRFNRASYLIAPECFISLQPSVSSRCNRRADER